MKFLVTTLSLLFFLSPAYAQLAVPGSACHGCAFSDDIDRLIEERNYLVANGDSCEPTNLLRRVPTQSGVPALTDDALVSFTTSKAVRWSAWSGHLEWLSWYLLSPNPAKPLTGTAGQYTRLPNAAGRQLFLAGAGPVKPGLLLEFLGARFRFIMLNYEAQGTYTYHFYHHADCDLLVFTNTDGLTSKIFNASTTWLSIFDLRSNTWLLDTVVEASSDDGDYWYTQRRYQVKDAGRTVVLGSYRDDKGRYRAATLTGKDKPRSNYTLPPGTYSLRDGRYQRATATIPTTARPGLAPAPRRLAVPAAEVNGTFRDAQGREFALLALGGGRLRVGFRDAGTKTAGVYHAHWFTHDASIAADSAVVPLPSYAGSTATCSLRLRFERPGTLQVHKDGASCTAEAVGTYTKVSAEKPTFRQ